MQTTLRRLQTGTTPPLTTSDLREHLRIDWPHEDEYLADLIQTATDYIEDLVGHALRVTPYRLDLERFPLPAEKVIEISLEIRASEVSSIAYTDAAGDAQTMPAEDYTLDSVSQPARVLLTADQWPTGTDVQINFTSAVPRQARQAVRLLAGHWYEHREAASDRTIKALPMGVMALVQQLRGVMIH